MEEYVKKSKVIRSRRGFSREIRIFESDGGRYVKKERRSLLKQLCLTFTEMLCVMFSFDFSLPRYISNLQAKINEANRIGLGIPTPTLYPVNGDLVVEDFVEGLPLDVYLEKCDENRIKEVGREIGERVAKLHHKNFAFGDFKASNVIISRDGKIFHTDFERSQKKPTRFQKNLDIATHIGSLSFLPRKTFESYYDNFLFGFVSAKGYFAWRTLLLTDFCSLFIHQRLLLQRIIPNMLYRGPKKYMSLKPTET